MAVRRMKADRLLGALERETRQLREEVKRGEKEDMACALSEDTLRLLQWTEEKTVLDDSQVRAVRAAKRKTSRLCAELKQKAQDCTSLIAALETKQDLTVLRHLKEEKEEATTLQTALETIDTDLARCEQARRTAETERLDALKAAVETINRRMSALFEGVAFRVVMQSVCERSASWTTRRGPSTRGSPAGSRRCVCWPSCWRSTRCSWVMRNELTSSLARFCWRTRSTRRWTWTR